MKKVFLIIVLAVFLAAFWLVWKEKTSPGDVVAEAQYQCADGKQIKAIFYSNPRKEVLPGEPPVPSGNVALTFGDGREMVLPQTISASGIRYANADESVVFWSKGESAFVTENNTETYSNCVSK